MCGIAAYCGKDDVLSILTEKLKVLEYRGYDSYGFAFKEKNYVTEYKRVGKISGFKGFKHLSDCTLGIAHTRWATNGKVSQENAHPQKSQKGEWYVVHNGIIENSDELKEEFLQGDTFLSQTDTEIFAHLLEKFGYKGINTLKRVCEKCTGSFAVACFNKRENTLYLAANKSPLYVAKGEKGYMSASDVSCFENFSDTFYRMGDGELCKITLKNIVFYDKWGNIIRKTAESYIPDQSFTDINGESCYMLKEINEIKKVFENISLAYTKEYLREKLKGINLSSFKRIRFVGCGTSYHACLYGAMLFEKYFKIDCTAVVASEYRYGNLIADRETLAFFVSQSGETADTLAGLEYAKNKGVYTIVITNVLYSAMASKADCVLPLCAGKEIAVASTKAYNAELAIFLLLKDYLTGCYNPLKLFNTEEKYYREDELNVLIEEFSSLDKLFIIGRGLDYYTSLEAALKLKEITYINAVALQSGELKHGFLALIEKGSYVVVFATSEKLFKKTMNNALEAKSRGAKLILFTSLKISKSFLKYFDKVVYTLNASDEEAILYSIIPWQYLSCKVSLKKGLEPDKPRNLAKSVTVE